MEAAGARPIVLVPDFRPLDQRRAKIPRALKNWTLKPKPKDLHVKDFVVLRTGEGESNPFKLARIMAKETIPDCSMAVRLLYYEHVEDHRTDRDAFTGWYEPVVQHDSRNQSRLPLMSIHGSAIVDKVRMNQGGIGGVRKRLSDCGVHQVKNWLRMG
jgi:hypothetical protein